MSNADSQEIARRIRQAAETGETLFVATAAKEIAGRSGGSPREIARHLTEAGIRAGLTMQFGTPE